MFKRVCKFGLDNYARRPIILSFTNKGWANADRRKTGRILNVYFSTKAAIYKARIEYN